MRRALATCGIGLAALAVAGCASSEPEPPPEPLTASAAGAVYLDAVCPVNAAWDEADVELDRLRLAEARGASPSTDDFAAAMRAVSEQSGEAARVLESEKRVWPTDAQTAVSAVAQTLAADQKQAERVAALRAADAVAYTWAGAADMGRAASDARAALGLPEDADAACAQWAQQRADAADRADGADGADRGSGGKSGGGDDAVR